MSARVKPGLRAGIGLRNRRQIETQARRIARRRARSRFGSNPASVCIAPVRLSDQSGVRYLVIHGYVTIVTEKGIRKEGRVFLAKKETEEFGFRMRIDVKQNKALGFKWI